MCFTHVYKLNSLDTTVYSRNFLVIKIMFLFQFLLGMRHVRIMHHIKKALTQHTQTTYKS